MEEFCFCLSKSEKTERNGAEEENLSAYLCENKRTRMSAPPVLCGVCTVCIMDMGKRDGTTPRDRVLLSRGSPELSGNTVGLYMDSCVPLTFHSAKAATRTVVEA